ncbi:hypothetical protein GCM10009689_25090 [Brevibacterium antiquum]
MTHPNALLTPRARLRLARLIVEDGYPATIAAKMFMFSPITARKWAGRYREEGEFGMQDRSSKPHRIPARTPEHVRRSSTCAGGFDWGQPKSLRDLVSRRRLFARSSSVAA